MSLIKKLILKEWFKSFFAAVIVLATLVSVADLVSGFLRGSVTAKQVLINHFIEYPTYLTQIFPVACLVASLFCINKLKTSSQLTAIFASGFSRRKFFITIFQASLVVAAVQFYTSAEIQPFIKKHRFELLGEAQERFSNLEGQGLKASTIASGKMWFKSHHYFASFVQFDKSNLTLFDATFFFMSDQNKISKIVKADKLTHIDEQKWRISKGTKYKKLEIYDFPKYEKLENDFILLNETPEDFVQLESDITALGVFALWGYISQLQRSGLNVNEYLILFLNHFSSTVVCIIFALLASVAAFNPNRRNSSFGKSLAFVFTFTVFYLLVFSYLIEMGRSGTLSPFVSVFSVPIFFTIVLITLFFYHRKLRG